MILQTNVTVVMAGALVWPRKQRWRKVNVGEVARDARSLN